MKFRKFNTNVIMFLLIGVLVIGGLVGASMIKQNQQKDNDVVVQGNQIGKEPTATPSSEPTKEPTKKPTATPSSEPTKDPAKKSTATPSLEPTKEPIATPSPEPTKEPTKKPTATPSPTPMKKPTATLSPKPTKEPTKKPTATPSPKPTKKPTATPSPEPTKEPTKTPTATPTPTPATPTCTITIRCDTILSNMENLTEGKSGLVPSDGYILKKTTVEFTEGETVFDVLSRVCKNNRIQLEYAYTPAYKSYYIEGINNLYEFDCGPDSGWMYKVNDWFPNYGCSSYPVKEGDEIVWCYTCNGLGADVGA